MFFFSKWISRFCSESVEEVLENIFCLTHMYLTFTTETKQLFTLKLSFNRYNLFFLSEKCIVKTAIKVPKISVKVFSAG